jgi:hypothetical protein
MKLLKSLFILTLLINFTSAQLTTNLNGQSSQSEGFIWRHLSTTDGSLPPTNGSTQQTASLVADVNGDGVNDIFITDRTISPSVIGLLFTPEGWIKLSRAFSCGWD